VIAALSTKPLTDFTSIAEANTKQSRVALQRPSNPMSKVSLQSLRNGPQRPAAAIRGAAAQRLSARLAGSRW
jgi:hypothetical protein